MKILTVCQRGNNRSAALAYILRDERGPNEVIACGPETSSEETMTMLCNWADKIICVAKGFDVPERWQYKRIRFDIGDADYWGVGFHPDLLAKLRKELDENSNR